MSIEDFEADGFKVYSDDEHPKKITEKSVEKITKKPVEKLAEKKSPYDKSQPSTKIIIMDNREVLKAVEASNKTLKAGFEKLIKSMYSMHPAQEKPNNISVKIERDNRGLMTGATLKVES